MKLFDVEQAAKELRVCPATVRHMVKEGAISHRRMGGTGKKRIFFTQDDLAAFIEAAKIPARNADDLPEAGL